MEIRAWQKLMIFALWFIGISRAADTILVLYPGGNDFEQTIEAMRQALDPDFLPIRRQIKSGETWSEVRRDMQRINPRALVLMDNQAVNIYRNYAEETRKSGGRVIPAVALMALQLEQVVAGLKINGISYEIPVVTSIVNLRSISLKPVRTVGVVYRKSWESFIRKNAEYCRTEQAELIGYAIADAESNLPSAIANGLNHLLNVKKVDALWILNDNVLLNAQTLTRSWIPLINKSSIPVIVGVETLVQTKFELGSFAVIPDHRGLGAQAANMIYDLSDNQWNVFEAVVDQPLSVIKIVNSSLARKKGFLNESGMKYMDKEVR